MEAQAAVIALVVVQDRARECPLAVKSLSQRNKRNTNPFAATWGGNLGHGCVARPKSYIFSTRDGGGHKFGNIERDCTGLTES